MATTTSVQDSGLMTWLLPHFESVCNCKVDVIAVGTGQALKLASNGDVDLVVVHDPQSEKNWWTTGLESGDRFSWSMILSSLGRPRIPHTSVD